ncbi:MAG: glucoamylase family protein, partial [Gemmatimonadales bacterium]
DWEWARNGGVTISHGWRPERGFLRYRWEGYSEALLLYILALGSPTNPVPPESYAEFTRLYRWIRLYGTEYLHAGPLFIHQTPHVWLDLGGIQDRYMRNKGIDYFENSRRATLIQREYARRNPRGHANYSANSWGITASDGPGPSTRRESGRTRRYYGYRARGVPWGVDDGTLSPWAVATSMPFAPEIVLEALRHRVSTRHESAAKPDHHCSVNHSFTGGKPEQCWVSRSRWAIDQGPVVLMLENYRTGLIWQLMRRSRYLVAGLRQAGFDGGWLSA